MSALSQFNAGLAPPNWRRESSADGITFVHTDRGVRLEAEAVGVEERTPGLDAARWRLSRVRPLGATLARESLARVPDRESAIERLYARMREADARRRKAGESGETPALPVEATGETGDRRRRDRDRRGPSREATGVPHDSAPNAEGR